MESCRGSLMGCRAPLIVSLLTSTGTLPQILPLPSLPLGGGGGGFQNLAKLDALLLDTIPKQLFLCIVWLVGVNVISNYVLFC